MRIFQALKSRNVLWLWGGQVFSAMGDEVYGIALVWYAADLMGTNAGYLSAIQAGALFIFSLIGGVWADHHDHRKVMIFSDLVRGTAVLALPVIACFVPLTLWMLIPVAITVSSLTAFFGPALAAFLPQLSSDRALLLATNGLMETTSRIARIIAPGVVAVLSRQIPLIHYFTVDAVSFAASALSLSRVQPDPNLVQREDQRTDFKTTLLTGFNLSRTDSALTYTIYSGAFAGAAWMFFLPLGMTLYIRERLPTNIGALGLLIFAYGIGNVISNVIAANFQFRNPERWIFTGRIVAGVGIFLFGFSSTPEQMMLAAALTAVGGPLTDLGYVNFIQKLFSGRDIARITRYITAVGQGSLLVFFSISPMLFKLLSVPLVIICAAIVVFLSGLLGFAFNSGARRQPALK